jgi:hypothetical protein
VLGLPCLYPAISSWFMAGFLLACAALGWVAVDLPWPGLRLLAFLPTLLLFDPLLSHSPLGDSIFTPARLGPICAANDGTRPLGFADALTAPRYFGVTRLDDELALLTGERGSFWLRRDAGTGRFAFAERSAVSGNFWEGCAQEQSVWLTKRGQVVRVTRLPDGSTPAEEPTEVITRFDSPPQVDGAVELDFVDAICDPAAGVVYASELIRGGLRVLVLADGAWGRRRQLGGINLQLVRRADGMLVGIDTARLFVYDPRRDQVVESHAAGIAAMGLDVCPRDGTAAIADMAGRLRVFARGASGRYTFERGRLLAAPRRVAFSPDCALIATTSGDDHTVTILRRADLRVLRRFRVGPALRDLAFVDERELAVADACTATFLDLAELAPGSVN